TWTANPAIPKLTGVLRRSRSPHQSRSPARPVAHRYGATPRWWISHGPRATQSVIGAIGRAPTPRSATAIPSGTTSAIPQARTPAAPGLAAGWYAHHSEL